jgi:hypothetical protein
LPYGRSGSLSSFSQEPMKLGQAWFNSHWIAQEKSGPTRWSRRPRSGIAALADRYIAPGVRPHANSLNRDFAAFRSAVSKPSLNRA